MSVVLCESCGNENLLLKDKPNPHKFGETELNITSHEWHCMYCKHVFVTEDLNKFYDLKVAECKKRIK